MATGGYERLPDHDDYDPPGLDDNDDNADQTTPFYLFSSPTPGPYDQQIEFQTMQKEKSCFAAS